MADARTAGGTVPKTPTHNVTVDSMSELKSTPFAVGSATISEHISTVGVDVNDIRPWIGRDVESYRECHVDEMLQELLFRCVDRSKPLPDKPALLADCLKAVLPICNEGQDAQTIKKHLGDIVASKIEEHMYKPFVQASNLALDKLSRLNAPGLVCSKGHDDDKILFHRNDPKNIIQKHQGATSTRKPDVVIVSRSTCAKKAGKQSGQAYKDEVASEKPSKLFNWTDVRSTVEFKHKKTGLSTPPATYAAKAYDVPEAKKYMKYRRETNDTSEPTDSTHLPLLGSGVATSSLQTSETRGRSNQSGAPNNKKRGSDQPPEDRSTKKLKVDNDEKEPPKEPLKIHPVLHNGLYAAELFAAHIVRQSVITYIVEDDMIYLWYFDRQDAIQCSGINFVQDLPRFMVLLLAMQRMPYAEWGYNRLFEPVDGSSGEVRVPDEDIGEVDLTFDLKSDKRVTHFGLRGRATTVFPVKSKALSALMPTLPHHNPHNPTSELVAKLYWPEEERESEAEILKKVYKIAEKDKVGKVKYHVPEMVWSHKFEDTSTANIRTALGLKDAERGRRVLYIIVFKKLDPITDLSEDEFLSAWWQIILCHYALWENQVHHRDVSPSNLMVYKTSDGRYIGVLNDFDLSSTRETPSGQERTGTVPFMALRLLKKDAIEGKVQHLYQHDAESFLWVFAWVCLRYEDGRLLSKATLLNEWLKLDAIQCFDKKNAFLMEHRHDMTPSQSHKKNWDIVQICLDSLASYYSLRPSLRSTMEDHVAFKTWLEDHIHNPERLSPRFLDVCM
ncbi:hypothetical protein CY34DRAFT_806604 [Suillus luteus UH-Slu-Lm8-n1]|uniref:Unplaced genomic scaffold CY34scaffold_152, whole genome shotgun sequence n=1 Tax=Suillus luteus UH-Slu-Lm8-n1 TaxID=930992 RepID=A0A0C9ZT48_9AGAM|nr:hypothetical protein CY34DRAFT_806604 [Suillus luteus UH-Slu-Lm8-n1]